MNILISKDGTKIAYDKRGAGPALIVVGGALTTRTSGSVPTLAGLLSEHFTVYTYDRRSRGDSDYVRPGSDEEALAHEIEDIEALADDAGGTAYLYGHSSGAALTLEAASRLPGKITKAALYDVPYNDDAEARKSFEAYGIELARTLAEGRASDAVVLFMTLVGVPAEKINGMRDAPFWAGLESSAPSLEYDRIVLGKDASIPSELAAAILVPVLVMHGGESYPFMQETAKKLIALMPHAQPAVLEGQDHEVAPEPLAKALTEFFIAA